MRKHSLYFVFLVSFAALAILVACGEGEIASASEDLDLEAPGKFVDKCLADKEYDDRCTVFEKAPSSDSKGGSSGSGGGDEDGDVSGSLHYWGVTTGNADVNEVSIPIGDCLDAEYTWANSGWHPDMYVRCDIDPSFAWAETSNQSRKGYVELTYNGDKKFDTGEYGVHATIKVASSLQVTTAPVKITQICTKAYLISSSNEKVAEATGKSLKCKMTTNG